MSYRLSDNVVIKYNDTDRRMFALIGDQPKNTIELLNAYYQGRDRPFNVRETVVGKLKTLARKFEVNKEPFQLVSSKRSGSNPIEWHLAPRIITAANRNAYLRSRLRSVKAKVEAA